MALNPLNHLLSKLFFCAILFFISFFLGFYTYSYSSPSTAPPSLKCSSASSSFPPPPPLDFQPHHTISLPRDSNTIIQDLLFCPSNFTNYIPCHDPSNDLLFYDEKFFHRERHCPDHDQKLKCLVPPPPGYKKPFSWPKSRNYAWFKNVPSKKLTVYKKSQNWVRLEGDLLVFPGGGTSFPKGVKSYVDEMKRLVPLKAGNIRTVLDVGCGVASFGGFFMDYNILTMSIAPVDIHEAQVQFALERGIPAMIGVVSTHRLPFPSRSFDMSHCSRCLVQWTNFDGLYLIEIDRVLRPGGYWVLSGPPINWKVNYKGWQRPAEELKKEQERLEDLARRLCWKKVAEKGNIAVWQKPTNHVHCIKKTATWRSPKMCLKNDPDDGWYRKMEPCITPLPNVTDVAEISGGALAKWPKRLYTAPPRILSAGISLREFQEDNAIWKRRIGHYQVILKSLFEGRRFRNVMDMNAGIGSFAAALNRYPMWVMNVVPFEAKSNLSVVYDRGLIGTFMNWCEAFSTYPRTYDMIHAYGIFSMYLNKCDILDILLEMYRILRPGGAVIVRDHVDVIVKVRSITDRMNWNGKIFHSENGPIHAEKILLIDNSEPDIPLSY